MKHEIPFITKFTKSGYWGMVLCFISSMLLSLGTMMVSHMKQFHPITKSFWRFAGTFVPAIFVVAYYVFKGENVHSTFWPMTTKKSLIVMISLFFRSFFGCTGATFQYYSLKYMPLGDSSVICNAYPMFVAFLACIFLGERFGLFNFFSTLITLAGIVFITRPPMLTGEGFDRELLIGAGLALGCAVFLSAAIVMIRHLKEIHHSITLIGFGFWGTIESAILAFAFGVMEFPTELNDILMGVATGLLSCGSQMFLIFALKCDSCGPVALVKTTDVIFAFLWQGIFFGIYPDVFSVVGAVVLITGILLCGFSKWIATLDEKNSIRQRLWFVLK
ncbi:unnamed protein product [Allacma fusca]|uniref:EamA domain-containing protein n=1 Tax=Allacma fusca TaxID=39272 RepID=A0A8J2PF94_9HEXA|nr:unnamed protein product [Allacma fusca]